MENKKSWREKLEPFRSSKKFDSGVYDLRPEVVRVSSEIVDQRWKDVGNEEKRLRMMVPERRKAGKRRVHRGTGPEFEQELEKIKSTSLMDRSKEDSARDSCRAAEILRESAKLLRSADLLAIRASTYAHNLKRAEEMSRKKATLTIANRLRDDRIEAIKQARELHQIRFNADFDPDRFVDSSAEC